MEESGTIPEKWTIKNRREMAIVVVAEAWAAVASNKDLISKAFPNCGIFIHSDGSQDYMIFIKDIDNQAIDPNSWRGYRFDKPLEEHAVIDQTLDLAEQLVAIGEDLTISRAARLKKADLQEECGKRGLATTGTRRDLIDRLTVIDSKEGVAERVEETELASEDIQDCIVVASDSVWLNENKDEDDSCQINQVT
jgi:hypothetical protein